MTPTTNPPTNPPLAKTLLAILPVFAICQTLYPQTLLQITIPILCALPAILIDLCFQWHLSNHTSPHDSSRSLHLLHFPCLIITPLITFCTFQSLAS